MTLPPSADAQRRRDRYRRRAVLRRVGCSIASDEGTWEGNPLRRCSSCGVINVEDLVSIKVLFNDDGPTAFASGLSTCGSVWACAVCSAKVRTRRQIEVQTIAIAHARAGGKLGMMTLTVRHSADHTLAELMDAQSRAWRSLTQSAKWRDLVRPNLSGLVRSWEVTQGFTRGAGGSWHPHFHVLLLWIDAPGDVAWIENAWRTRIQRRLGTVTNSHGFDYRDVDDVGAQYVAKIGAEMTRNDLKGNGAMIWQLLDAVEDGETWATRRVVEYVEATRGRNAIVFSRGLRERFAIQELTDQEIAHLEVEAVTVKQMAPAAWRRLCAPGPYRRPPAFVALLEQIEADARRSPDPEAGAPSTVTVPDDQLV